jgi:chromosome segregation ATPase
MDTKLVCQEGSRSVLSEAALRSAIESERARIAQLKDEIGDEPLRLRLQSAAGTLAFALIGFLDEKILERQQTLDELAAWLGQAERHLERATQMRKEVEEAVAQRGASVPEPGET